MYTAARCAPAHPSKPAWRTSDAKQWAQNGICCAGFAKGTVKKYTLSLRMIMDASVLYGAPVCGLVPPLTVFSHYHSILTVFSQYSLQYSLSILSQKMGIRAHGLARKKFF